MSDTFNQLNKNIEESSQNARQLRQNIDGVINASQ